MIRRLLFSAAAGLILGLMAYAIVAILSLLHAILPLWWLLIFIGVATVLALLFDIIGPRLERPPDDQA